jgi:DNA invertase Pin-like site-specific DNA recombinase
MSKTTKAIIYCKLSKMDEGSVQFERQYQELLDLAHKDGYTDITVLETKTFSGKPQFESLMKAIESGEYAAIYVHSLSRISNNAGKLRDFFDKVDKTGTELKVTTLPQLPEPSIARSIMLDLVAQITEREYRDCSIRTKQGMKI